jgi:sulfite reductase alpha subunit-like flavoprotein
MSAFSRESDKKRYVQDIVREETEMHKILTNLNERCRVVICGNTPMCRGVCEAIANQIGGQAQLERLEKAGIVLVEYFG